MPTLNLGPGFSGQGDVKIDLIQYPGQTIDHILDLAVESIPYPDNYFSGIVAAQLLEHIPTQLRWREYRYHRMDLRTTADGAEFWATTEIDWMWHLRFPRVELMREIHRVLKPGCIFRASVPIKWPEWAQDPTHTDVPWTKEQFSYFCGEWGGNRAGHEATESSGINFAFEMVMDQINDTGSILTVELRKPV